MVQLDTTSPVVAGLGGAGGAMEGLQRFRGRQTAIEAEQAQMVENRRRTDIAQAALAQGQSQFEREQAFRERLNSQHESALDRSRGSAQTQAQMMLDAAQSAEGTTTAPMTPAEGQEDESPLAPQFRQQWRTLRGAIDSGKIQGEDAAQAVKFLAEQHASALVKHHANGLIQRIHNAVAGGAFTIDENGDGEPDQETAQIPDRWIAELKDGSTDPRVVEKEFADVQQHIAKGKIKLADRVKATTLWTQAIDQGRTTGTISQPNAAQMLVELQRLHNGEFEDKTTGHDDEARFNLFMGAAQNGQVVAKMPWGEVAMDPKVLAVMAAMRQQLAITGSRRAPSEPARPKPATPAQAEQAATRYADGLFPDKKTRDAADWKASYKAKLAELTGTGPVTNGAAPEPPRVSASPGDPTAPVTDPAGLQARIKALSPEDRARYERRVQELQGQP